ncbi:l-ornithine N(alpha)-acyltransferase [Paenochrobactrum sp. BZR 201-1]
MALQLGKTTQIVDNDAMIKQNTSGVTNDATENSNGNATGNSALLGRMGALEVRLATTTEEIEAAQELRFRVFYDEMGAKKDALQAIEQRDADRFDPVCDHLLVYDTALPGPQHKQIVGTYRLMRTDQANKTHGFYSASEYDVQRLTLSKPELNFLELGRSCVKPEYRSKRTVELLWQGIWAYCRRHSIDVMMGCASFQGAVPMAHALCLSFLNQNARADSEWDVRALPEHYHAMDLMPAEGVNMKLALFSMPPLIKGYLRLGGMIGDGAVADESFGTTDVFIILPVSRISSRYISYYGAEADRFI